MERVRKPFEGVWNIIRFNWHFYFLSAGVLLLLLLYPHFDLPFRLYSNILFFIIIAPILVSLAVSYYVYDFSYLYKLSWLNNLAAGGNQTIVNIHAGFDETSTLLKSRFKNADLQVFDFYDPLKHTEVSIKRARAAYPSYPGTQHVNTSNLPLESDSVDLIFTILAAHEIRNDEERIIFFEECARILKPSGQIIVTEHLRDMANFCAYNIGFFHFHSKVSWLRTFAASGLQVKKEIKITPFISTFILRKNGISS